MRPLRRRRHRLTALLGLVAAVQACMVAFTPVTLGDVARSAVIALGVAIAAVLTGTWIRRGER